MTTTLGFKDLIDLPQWQCLAPGLNNSTAGVSLAWDARNSTMRHPVLFQLASATVLNQYNPYNDGWSFVGSPALAGTFGAGAVAKFMPSRGPRGTIAAGATTTSIVLSTALPAAVGVNQLSGRGAGISGFKIRIIGNAGGSSGKVEERTIISNTSGTTPTIYLDSALTFTPANGDGYEILSGRVYLLNAGTVAAGIFKYYDVATNSFSGNLGTTNLPTIGTDSSMVALDEAYVPYNKSPGQGFFGNITASASTSTTITSAAAQGDAAVAANEYRNFQVRVVQDTTTPTAVGQRRKITSHTAGPNPVYTVPSWTVTPSSSAVFVIENSNELLLWTAANAVTYTYAQDAIGAAAADSWSTSTYGNRPAVCGAGVSSFQSFGLALPATTTDPGKLLRHSHIFSFRGAASTTLHLLDIAGASTGAWTTETYASIGTTFTTGTCLCYDPVSRDGTRAYLSLNGTQHVLRFNITTRNLDEWAYLRFAQSTAVAGERLALTAFIDSDDDTRVSFINYIRSSGTELFRSLVQR